MDWAAWLRNAAIVAAAAALCVAALRTRAGTSALRAVVSAVTSWSSRRALVVVLALTAATRLALLPAFEPATTTDIAEYVAKAEAIAEHGHPREQELRH